MKGALPSAGSAEGAERGSLGAGCRRMVAHCFPMNEGHRYGAGKARFFRQFGFRVEEWEKLAGALRKHGACCAVAAEKETIFGLRYEVEGPLRSPDGRAPLVKSVWQLDRGQFAPRLITAYPVKGSKP